LQIERFLTKRIRTAYPDHSLIGEEGTRVEGDYPASDMWVIDPPDGTTALCPRSTRLGYLHRFATQRAVPLLPFLYALDR
jgi:hypothetical protein